VSVLARPTRALLMEQRSPRVYARALVPGSPRSGERLERGPLPASAQFAEWRVSENRNLMQFFFLKPYFPPTDAEEGSASTGRFEVAVTSRAR